MRTTVPPAFQMSFVGPEGSYDIDFRPTDEWDGLIDVTIRNLQMEWSVVDASRERDGAVVLGGMTTGSEELWGDQFWFELRVDDTPPIIRYWGDRVIWREDRVALA